MSTDDRRLPCVLAVAGALLLVAAGAAAEVDYARILRERAKSLKDPDRAKKLAEKVKQERAKEQAKRRREAAKLSLKMVKSAFEKGKKAYSEERYSEAYLHFQDVVQSRHAGARGIVAQAKTKLSEIDGMAASKLEQARVLLLQQRPVDAAVTLQHVVASFSFCDAAAEARMQLRILKSSPSVAAAVRFAEGKAQEDADNHVEAYRIYEEGAERWPHELGAEEARRAIRDLRADAEKFKAITEAKDEETESECRKRLLKAQNFLVNEMAELARRELEWIRKNAPGTSFAEEAEQLLFQIDVDSPADTEPDDAET
jgi:hypothetical protein